MTGREKSKIIQVSELDTLVGTHHETIRFGVDLGES